MLWTSHQRFIFSVDCKVSQWNVWDSCSVTCGSGTKKRTRNVAQEPKNGGAMCPDLEETMDCNTDKCPGTLFHIASNFHLIMGSQLTAKSASGRTGTAMWLAATERWPEKGMSSRNHCMEGILVRNWRKQGSAKLTHAKVSFSYSFPCICVFITSMNIKIERSDVELDATTHVACVCFSW